ncbi:MAG: hypothetical protein IJZ14_03145, partial [Oscillospiraceae bacterium]|nr:hypothetical protein [Oscillospiraceae bacterium]
GVLTVAHNADGTGNMPFHVSIPDIKSVNKYGPPAMALSGTWALTTIPRASMVSCPVGVIGKPVTVAIQKSDGAFLHTLTYQFGNLYGTIAQKTADTTVAWTIPTDFYTQIPNAKRGQGTLVCQTYNGDLLVGTSTCQLLADIDEADSLPMLSAQVMDTNPATIALTGDSNTLVRYYSTAGVTAVYSAKNSATVAGYTLTHNGKTYTAGSVDIPNVEKGKFDFSVTDSRGLTTSLYVKKTVVSYVKLTCNLEASRPDGEGKMALSASGNYFRGSFGAEKNTLQVQCRYKLSGTAWQDTEDSWQDMKTSGSGNRYAAQTELTGLDYQKAYTFQIRAVDRLATVYSVEYTARATPIFDWGEQDFAIHGDLQVDGNVSVSDVPVLTTPHVQTYCWQTTGGVSMASVAEFMAAIDRDCGFIAYITGTAYPFVGVVIGVAWMGGQYGAGTLYDYHNGVQPFRMFGGQIQ